MDVVVTGIGLLSSLGNRQQSWQALVEKKSGIRLHQPFIELPQLPLGLIKEQPISLRQLTEIVLAEAIEDAQLEIPVPDCAVVIGSSRGCQAEWEDLAVGRIKNIESSNWLESLPNQRAIAVANHIGATGIVLAPMAACSTGLWAIAQAFDLIRTGKCQQAIAGSIETPITRLTIAGFERMGALAKTGCYPFDRRREGLVLAEGGAILVLESAESALSRGAFIYGKISGFGLTCDAYHVSAPHPNQKSASIAVKQCLDRSGLNSESIDFIHTHGTSTKLNDRHEAQLIQYLFPQGIPISSTKGATGHTLGASGAIGAAFCLMALKQQILPACVGLKELEFDLDVIFNARPNRVDRILCFSFGFGGQNAVIAMEHY